MSIDYSISALNRYKQVIIDSHLQLGLDTATMTFGPAKPTTRYGFNSRAVAKIYKGVKLKNCVALYINRVDLNLFFTENNYTDINTGGAVTTHDLLPIILSEFGVNLTTDDILLENLVDVNDTITATTSSIGWTGSYAFNAIVPVWPPLLRTSSELLFVTSTGKYIRKAFPEYNP